MPEVYTSSVMELHQKYAKKLPQYLTFASAALFRNLYKLAQLPENAEKERQEIYPTLIREFLILANDPNVEQEFIESFSEIVGVDINYLIRTYVSYLVEAA